MRLIRQVSQVELAYLYPHPCSFFPPSPPARHPAPAVAVLSAASYSLGMRASDVLLPLVWWSGHKVVRERHRGGVALVERGEWQRLALSPLVAHKDVADSPAAGVVVSGLGLALLRTAQS